MCTGLCVKVFLALMKDKPQKSVSILNLSNTGSRQNSVGSLVESILYSYNEMLTVEQTAEVARDVFGLGLSKQEVEGVLPELVEKNKVSLRGNKFLLTEECYQKIKHKEEEHTKLQNSRFYQYKTIVKAISAGIDDKGINFLWDLLNEYISDSFYDYSILASNNIPANKSEVEYAVSDNSLSSVLAKISDASLQHVFRQSIVHYVNEVEGEGLKYLENMGTKTLAFSSLGLPVCGIDAINTKEQVDIVLIVDSGCLLAILGLEETPETQAVKGLINLIQKFGFKVSVRYLPLTLMALREKKSYFDKLIPCVQHDPKLVSAMLEATKLDSFSKAWYERFLKNNNELHPSLLIDNAEQILSENNRIEKYNYRFESVFNEDVIQSGITRYGNYLKRFDKLTNSRQTAIEEKLQHDIFMLNAVEHLRNETTGTDVQYIGLTTDRLLAGFDKYTGQTGFARFFLPSALLNKLYNLLPVTDDSYRKLFVKSVISFTANENTERSKDIQEFVSYYSGLGLKDEKLLLSFITDEDFLKDFHDKNENERRKFVEWEINKKAQDAGYRADELSRQLQDVVQELAKTKEEATLNEAKIRMQENEILALKAKQALFESELNKLLEMKQATVEQVAEVQANNADVVEKFNEGNEIDIKESAVDTILINDSPVTEVNTEKKVKRKPALYIILVLVITIVSGGVYILFTGVHHNESGEKKITVNTKPSNPVINNAANTNAANESIKASEPEPVKQLAVLSPKTAASSPAPVKSKLATTVDESRVKSDLVGKKLSGCGITVKSASEISNISNLVFVDKLASGFMKYKFSATIVQGGDTYKATPYIYYNSEGVFLKVDGTTCE
jgi:hypothetical protein